MLVKSSVLRMTSELLRWSAAKHKAPASKVVLEDLFSGPCQCIAPFAG